MREAACVSNTVCFLALCFRYTTANAESDYNGETDKETDRDTEEEEDDEEVSCATVKALRRDSLSLDDDPIAQLTTELPDDEFNLLLETSDRLHTGTIQDHTEGFQLLLSNKPMVSVTMALLDMLYLRTAAIVFQNCGFSTFLYPELSISQRYIECI